MPPVAPSDQDVNPSDDLTNSLFNGLLHVQDPITKVKTVGCSIDTIQLLHVLCRNGLLISLYSMMKNYPSQLRKIK